ncbi:MAG: MerR family transcriptional regulator [Paracoccaceae bacterium]
MEKSPDAFRTISEVADDLGVPAHVLRFWETKFHQISPVKRGGGRRYYRPDDVRLLRGLQRLLHGDGLTIRGAQKLLRENGIRHVVDLGAAQAKAAPKPAALAPAPPKATPAEPPAKPAPIALSLREIHRQLVTLRARVADAADRDIDSL